MHARGMLIKILVFGNALVEEDSIPLRLLPRLRRHFPDIDFKEADTAENLEDEGRDLIILDAALGIESVTLIDDIDNLSLSKTCSMHDFDLPLTLRVLQKMKAIDSVQIIAVPIGYSEKKAFSEVCNILSTLLSENA